MCYAGFLYDYTQTYDCSFYLAGLCYLLSSLSLFMEPLAQRWKARNKMTCDKKAENSCRTNGCFTPEHLQNGVVQEWNPGSLQSWTTICHSCIGLPNICWTPVSSLDAWLLNSAGTSDGQADGGHYPPKMSQLWHWWIHDYIKPIKKPKSWCSACFNISSFTKAWYNFLPNCATTKLNSLWNSLLMILLRTKLCSSAQVFSQSLWWHTVHGNTVHKEVLFTWFKAFSCICKLVLTDMHFGPICNYVTCCFFRSLSARLLRYWAVRLLPVYVSSALQSQMLQ